MFKYHQEKGGISEWNFIEFVHLQLSNLGDRNDNRMFSSPNSEVVFNGPFFKQFSFLSQWRMTLPQPRYKKRSRKNFRVGLLCDSKLFYNI